MPPQGGGAADLPAVTPATRGALQAWLMVQSARLRPIDPHQMAAARYGIMERRYAVLENDRANISMPEVEHETRTALGQAHEAHIRPEYADALNNFLRLLDPAKPLHPVLHSQVILAFKRHREEGRLSPQVNDLVEAHGLEALAAQRYRLDGDGNFRAARPGSTPGHTPEREVAPRPSGEGSSPVPSLPEPTQPPSALSRLIPSGQLWLNQTMELSNAPRPRAGKLPDSRQYQHIKSMPLEDRTVLEAALEDLFMQPAGSIPPQTARAALETWLTAQQVRLRVHSEESLKDHAKALLSAGNAARVVKAALGGSRGRSEFARFHGEHESTKRPEYAIALNNFLRVLHSRSPLSPDLKQHVADYLAGQAREGTLSAPVLAAMPDLDPFPLAADGWKLDPLSNVFSPPRLTVIGPGNSPSHMAVPTRHRPASPRQP